MKSIGFILVFMFLFHTSFAQWQLLNAPSSSSVASIKATGNVLYAAAGKGFVRSNNGGSTWNSLTIPFIQVSSIAAKGSKVYIGCLGYDGIAYSSNSGNSWTIINDGLPGDYGKPMIICLAWNDTCVFTGTVDNGLYMLNTTGSVWTALNEGLPSSYGSRVNAIAFGDTNIYAGTSSGFFRFSKTLMKWIDKSSGIGGISALAINGSQIFAGTGNGIYLSSDRGETWTEISDGLNVGILSGAGKIIQSLVAANDKVFAGTGAIYENFYGGNGVYRFMKNENRWVEWNTGLPVNQYSPWSYYDEVIALELTTDKLFAGLYHVLISGSGGLFSRSLSDLNGIQSFDNTGSINIYPNPASTFLTMDFSGLTYKVKSIEVYNSNGIEIFKNQNVENKLILSVEDYPAGLYFIKLNTVSSIFAGKFLKK